VIRISTCLRLVVLGFLLFSILQISILTISTYLFIYLVGYFGGTGFWSQGFALNKAGALLPEPCLHSIYWNISNHINHILNSLSLSLSLYIYIYIYTYTYHISNHI
jgi:hypothetical protein